MEVMLLQYEMLARAAAARELASSCSLSSRLVKALIAPCSFNNLETCTSCKVDEQRQERTSLQIFLLLPCRKQVLLSSISS